jgi:rhodanese-related sulfurtransferase
MKTSILFLATALFAGTALWAEEPKLEAKPAAAQAAAKNVTPDQAEKLLKEKKEIVVLDVRTPQEFAAGHIAGAKNLDFQSADFAQKVGALDPSKSYLVHCAAGGRSSKAVTIMMKDKFADVYHMNDGFRAWQDAGKPIEK